MWLDTLEEHHYEALFEIQQRAESYLPPCTYMEFVQVMKQREGYVVVKRDGKLAGCVTFSSYDGQDLVIHCFIDPDLHGRWLRRGMYKEVMDYVFEEIGLGRISGFSVDSAGDAAGRFLLALGFKKEGTIRRRIKTVDGVARDVHIYGLLKEERRW